MPYFLAFQTTYEQIEIALFNGTHRIDFSTIEKHQASKQIIATVDSLIKKNNLSWQDLSFLAVNQGPAPFTSLRVVIATVNGLSFATHIPLIGIDGLETLLKEYQDPQWPITVAILNAFAHDLYFSIQETDQSRTIGCEKYDVLFSRLKDQIFNQKIRFLGNGAELYRDQIITMFGTQAFIPEPLPMNCSLQHIGITALQRWQTKETLSHALLPLYLKNISYKAVSGL